MTEPKRNSALWLVFLAALMIAIFFVKAYGQHECQGGHNCNKDGGVVDTKVDIGGDSSKVYALSGGDMDIDDCLATYSVVFGLFQGTNINRLCEAERLNSQGKYLSAAEMKCSLFRFKRIYGKGQKCIDAVIYTEPTVITPQTPEDDARIEALYARLSEIEALRVQDKAEAEKAVETANIEAQRVNAVAMQVQQQIPNDAAERRAKARAALKGEE